MCYRKYLLVIVFVFSSISPSLGQAPASNLPPGFELNQEVEDALAQLKTKNLKIATRTIVKTEVICERRIERYGLFGRRCRVVLVPRTVKTTKTVAEAKDGFDGGLGWNEPSESEPNNTGLAISRAVVPHKVSPTAAGLRASRIKDRCLTYLTTKLGIPSDQLKWQIDSDTTDSKDLHLVISQREFVANKSETNKERSFRIFASIDSTTLDVVHVEVQQQQRLIGLDNLQQRDAKFYDGGATLKPTADKFIEYLQMDPAMKEAA